MDYKNKKCKHCKTEFQQTCRQQHYCSTICKINDNVKIDNNDCWNWQKSKTRNGYGRFSYNKKIELVHRVTCESVHGPAPLDKPFALHSCDNPSCCNPDHLRWGSVEDNMNDVKERNRGVKGENHGNSKLTEEQAIEIIDKLKNYKRGDGVKLAKEYNIHFNVISKIRQNKLWTHLPR